MNSPAVPADQTTGNVFRVKWSLPGQVIRIRLKIETNYRLYVDISSGAMINDLIMTLTSGLKVDAKCANQQYNWTGVANYFGTLPADWVHRSPRAHLHVVGMLRFMSLTYKPTKLAHSFLFCSCVCFYLYGPFNCISFHKFSPKLSAFPLSSSDLFLPYWSFQLYVSLWKSSSALI